MGQKRPEGTFRKEMTGLKKKYGFNFLWMFSKWGDRPPETVDERELDFVAEEGFNFVRIPADYRFWTKDFDYTHPDETVLAQVDRYLAACHERGLHVCFNLHRAPGYCINRPETERHNLWRDEEAQNGFLFLWQMFAERWKDVPSELLSFDLVNEPCSRPPTHPVMRDDHASLIRRTVRAIREIDPDRQIVIDGFDGGGSALPELADLGRPDASDNGVFVGNVIHSGRGYEPFEVSHYQAEWVRRDSWTLPVYPGEVSPGRVKNLDTLREYYRPWREVEQSGVSVHIGEFGCYNRLPNDVALRWLGDVVSLYREYGWGYSLWNFRGAFGIVDHGRPDTKWEMLHGMKTDRALLELLKSGMTD